LIIRNISLIKDLCLSDWVSGNILIFILEEEYWEIVILELKSQLLNIFLIYYNLSLIYLLYINYSIKYRCKFTLLLILCIFYFNPPVHSYKSSGFQLLFFKHYTEHKSENQIIILKECFIQSNLVKLPPHSPSAVTFERNKLLNKVQSATTSCFCTNVFEAMFYISI